MADITQSYCVYFSGLAKTASFTLVRLQATYWHYSAWKEADVALMALTWICNCKQHCRLSP
jgi:hypothetical protein